MPPLMVERIRRSQEFDLRCARTLHRASQRPRLARLLSLASHLGEAPMWLVAPLLMPLFDPERGPGAAALFLALGAVNLTLYVMLKYGTKRERPYRQCTDIRACVRASDTFSFPSGHTLHAVSFAWLLSSVYPSLTPLLWSFAGLVAASRVVLGVHFPSDVVAGALIGSLTAGVMLAFVPMP
jgi:undecaprenyl-diphosphatase